MAAPFGERDIVTGGCMATQFNEYADLRLPYVRRRTHGAIANAAG
jgi:hypothetical protein